MVVTFECEILTIRVRNKKKGVNQVEDAKIIELFFQRNEQAVKETDTAYGRKLYVLSNNILNNREDAEESVSDTYMETWKSIPPKRPKYFYAFLSIYLLHSVSYSHSRKHIVRPVSSMYYFRILQNPLPHNQKPLPLIKAVTTKEEKMEKRKS